MAQQVPTRSAMPLPSCGDFESDSPRIQVRAMPTNSPAVYRCDSPRRKRDLRSRCRLHVRSLSVPNLAASPYCSELRAYVRLPRW